tara:strand:+ start:2249 stop:2779 length:531 start_codon:yes stop_codon:yes gene_type:complete
MFDFTHTFSGKHLTFLDPKEDQIVLEDIANSLSKNCRYCGAVNKFYSVAEHSVLIAEKVLALGGDKQEALGALMHDASEAYLSDIPRPIKPHLVGYQEMEDRLSKVIFSKFKLEPITERVLHLDYNIVADEAKVLFNNVPEWVSHYEEIGVEVLGLGYEESSALFLETYYKLTEGE